MINICYEWSVIIFCYKYLYLNFLLKGKGLSINKFVKILVYVYYCKFVFVRVWI